MDTKSTLFLIAAPVAGLALIAATMLAGVLVHQF